MGDKTTMATLKIDNEDLRVPDVLVTRMTQRMWKLGTNARRAAYAERARKRLTAGHRGKNDITTIIVADFSRGLD